MEHLVLRQRILRVEPKRSYTHFDQWYNKRIHVYFMHNLFLKTLFI